MSMYRQNQNSGVTIIELLVVMAIGIIFMTGVFGYFSKQHEHSSAAMLTTQTQERIRGAIDMLVREGRMAGYDPVKIGFVKIPYISNRLCIRADLNGDGDTLDAEESICYSLNTETHTLNRISNNVSSEVAKGITTFTITYLDSVDNTVSATAKQADIRKIKVSLVGRSDRSSKMIPLNSGYAVCDINTVIEARNAAL
jgi:type IV pilus assembly protein PilW